MLLEIFLKTELSPRFAAVLDSGVGLSFSCFTYPCESVIQQRTRTVEDDPVRLLPRKLGTLD